MPTNSPPATPSRGLFLFLEYARDFVGDFLGRAPTHIRADDHHHHFPQVRIERIGMALRPLPERLVVKQYLREQQNDDPTERRAHRSREPIALLGDDDGGVDFGLALVEIK